MSKEELDALAEVRAALASEPDMHKWRKLLEAMYVALVKAAAEPDEADNLAAAARYLAAAQKDHAYCGERGDEYQRALVQAAVHIGRAKAIRDAGYWSGNHATL